MEPEIKRIEDLSPGTRRRVIGSLARHKGRTIAALEKVHTISGEALRHMRKPDSGSLLPGEMKNSLHDMQTSVGKVLSEQQQARATIDTTLIFTQDKS